jgi:three-Cys-motif partner protein
MRYRALAHSGHLKGLLRLDDGLEVNASAGNRRGYLPFVRLARRLSKPMNAKRSTGARTHRFGGDWTAAKLDVIARYLASYTTALKDKPSKEHPFVKGYIDAFAGTGYRDARRDDPTEDPSQALLLPDLAETEPQALLDGSARLALKTQPRFDRYVFIERSPERCAQLELLKQEFPDLAKDIQIRRGDANSEIQELCAKDWSSHRAVLFLDPYGMQVDWTTVEAIAQTKAIDLWVLFPLGVGVNRLLTKSGDIPDSWHRRLNLLLGTEEWYEEFYRSESTPTLFGGAVERVVKASTETIGRYFNNRLKSMFAAVADEPKVLRNSANSPLYLLCFAAGNPKGAPIALRIANHLLKKGTE